MIIVKPIALPELSFRTICFALIVSMLFAAPVGLSSLQAQENRTLDGSGNNPLLSSQGAANTALIRCCYEDEYPDGFGDQIVFPGAPNARSVSNLFGSQSEVVYNRRGLSDWVVQWGQFLAHDMGLTPTNAANNVLIDGSVGNFDIPILDSGDPLGPNPIRFNRSDFRSGTGLPGPPIDIAREQSNAVSAYLDGSTVYGVDSVRGDELRTFSGGRLETTAGGILPGKNDAGLPNNDPFGAGSQLFLAGDVRANENIGLLATHSLFVQEHNRLAGLIAAQDPTLNDEDIYQLARKIVGAEIQAITYNEFLPAILGDNAPSDNDYEYNQFINGSTTTAFSTAAFRIGHSMQSSSILLVDDDGVQVDEVSVRDAFFNPSFFDDNPDNVELVLNGLATQLSQENDNLIVDDLRSFLFAPGAGGTDLLAFDIQRGRDHGLPDYNELRTGYGLELLTDFSELTSDEDLQQLLEDIYGDIDSIDAFVGLLAEDHLAGASVGELTAAVIAQQFIRTRDGDRLFWINDPGLQTSLVSSIIDLENFTLSDLIRANTGLENIQDNAFFATQVIPEPSTGGILLGATLVLMLRRRKRERSKA